jgi:signal transduction histidine kinase
VTAPQQPFNLHEPLLANLLGHAAGSVVFAIFIALLLRDRGAGQARRTHRISLAAAVLALVWNATSVILLTAPTLFPQQAMLLAGAASLSILPAVLLHSLLGAKLPGFRAAAYALSAVAVAIHTAEPFVNGPEAHRTAVILTAIGFAALTAASAVVLRRAQTRTLAAMALFLFSLSFAHFQHGAAHTAWQFELLVHHAGMPLALFVLLQDHRFVLLDAFLRFLANFLLAALFTAGAWAVGLIPLGEWPPARTALTAMGICGLLIAFAYTRSLLQRELTRLVFRRKGLGALLAELREAACGDEDDYIEYACRRIAAWFGAETFRIEREAANVVPGLGAAAQIAPGRELYLGRRAGGLRYLSEDLEALSSLAAAARARLEEFRESEHRRLLAQAELRALQAQIHPHFLFNALNTLYGIIPKEARGARRTVLNLADIFRYFLRSGTELIPLEEEMRIVTAYLEIEAMRLGGRLRTEVEIDPAALRCPIPLLSLEPLVENAVKHGVAARPEGGVVRVSARHTGSKLEVTVSDNGAGFPRDAGSGDGAGVGLENVRRRLKLCYGDLATFAIRSAPDGATVTFEVPAAEVAP